MVLVSHSGEAAHIHTTVESPATPSGAEEAVCHSLMSTQLIHPPISEKLSFRF